MPDKKPSDERDEEDAPVLTEEHNSDHGDIADNSGKQRDRRNSSYFRIVARWTLRNRMVVAILALLLGGFVALCIYFGGKS